MAIYSSIELNEISKNVPKKDFAKKKSGDQKPIFD